MSDTFESLKFYSNPEFHQDFVSVPVGLLDRAVKEHEALEAELKEAKYRLESHT